MASGIQSPVDRTAAAVQKQVSAMGSDLFEIGVFLPDSPTRIDRSMLLRIWDTDTLLRSLPWLRHQNRDGANIYIRPHGEHNLNLVDDLKKGTIAAMKQAGFAPALVVETSPNNYQAWMKHPETLSRETSTATARALARKFAGDLGSADWRHFGRLAGFTNRKLKYQDEETGLFPFVKLIEASGLTYSQGLCFIGKVKEDIERETRRRREQHQQYQAHGETKAVKTIGHFRQDPRYRDDFTRSDLAYAVYALSHGVGVSDVSAALRSRDLSHKGNEKRQLEYVDRTIRKAADRAIGR